MLVGIRLPIRKSIEVKVEYNKRKERKRTKRKKRKSPYKKNKILIICSNNISIEV
tara:strand:- start:5178 stop:5342 length:165 start_codon:yes stop_codon:yes gene_type:complete